MKVLYVCLLLFISSCASNKVTGVVAFSSPQATFETLVTSILNDDLETYKTCWEKDRLESEGMYSKLTVTSSKWLQLKEIFKGPQIMLDKSPKEGATFFKTSIDAPQAKHGGIGTISMKKNGDKWLMYSW